ncbi:MAG: hypothetical protein WCG01_04535 [bacterium]
MSTFPSWLPDVVPFSDFDCDLKKYLDHLHGIFEKDFLVSRPVYNGKPVFFDKNVIENYSACFWHLITESKIADYQRVDVANLSLLRCERICWMRPVIENHKHQAVSVWENTRGRKTNTLFLLEDYDYIVVLTNIKDKFYLVTAYYIAYPNRKRELIAERDRYLQSKNRLTSETV